MSARADRRVELAREAAAFLDSVGEHKRANDVRSLCVANASYKVTLSQLHKDNMILRSASAPRGDAPNPSDNTITGDEQQ